MLTNAENNTIVYSLCLIDKLCKKNKGFSLTKKNIYRVFFMTLLTSIKLLEDKTYNDMDYACFSGISIYQLVDLEKEFLSLLDYDVNVKDNAFMAYLNALI